MNCPVCEDIASKTNMVYEDDVVFAMHHAEPATSVHLVVVPKQHTPILEKMPDQDLGKLFSVVNKLSTLVFDKLGAHGTNIILQNGTAAGQSLPHTQVHIIPRHQNDKISFEWQPKQLSDDDMATVELTLKGQAKSVGVFEKEKKVIEEKKPEQVEEKEDVVDYRLKRLERLP